MSTPRASHPRPTWTVAQVAAETGLSVHTLRYYERDGLLLQAVERSSTGRRLYTERDLTWISLITKLRATGMPIRDIRAYAELVRTGDGNEEERLELLYAHRDHVLAQLADVRRHLDAIETKMALYESRRGDRASKSA